MAGWLSSSGSLHVCHSHLSQHRQGVRNFALASVGKQSQVCRRSSRICQPVGRRSSDLLAFRNRGTLFRHGTCMLLSRQQKRKVRLYGNQPRLRRAEAQALNGGSRPPFQDGRGRNGSAAWDPLLGAEEICPVPENQQPINEYKNLLDMGLFSWVTMSSANYALRLIAVGAIFSAVIGWPVASITYNPADHTLQCVIASLAAGQVAATLATLRLYLGWAYVGNRLFSATVEYEETGWYDGQVWVKTPELLARDRLLASYNVKPVLNRLKATLIGLAVAVATSSVLLIFFPEPDPLPLLTSNVMENPRVVYSATYDPNAARRYEPAAFEDEDSNENAPFPLPASCMMGLDDSA